MIVAELRRLITLSPPETAQHLEKAITSWKERDRDSMQTHICRAQDSVDDYSLIECIEDVWTDAFEKFFPNGGGF